MVFKVRGLFINLTFPYPSFPSSSLTRDQLVPLFYEAIMRLERCGFKVSCITLDENSVNRKFFKLVGNTPCDDTCNINYYTSNPSAWFNFINRGGLTRCSNDFYLCSRRIFYFSYLCKSLHKHVLTAQLSTTENNSISPVPLIKNNTVPTSILTRERPVSNPFILYLCYSR